MEQEEEVLKWGDPGSLPESKEAGSAKALRQENNLFCLRSQNSAVQWAEYVKLRRDDGRGC